MSTFHKFGKLRSLLLTLLVFVGLVGLFSLRSQVLAVSGNLVTTNPGFESGTFGGWNNNSGWVNQTSVKHSGSRAAYCNYTGAGSCSTSINTTNYSVTEGHSISFSIWGYFSNASSTMTLQPIWTLSSGAVFADPESVIDVSGSWRNATINQVAPNNATGLKIKVTISAVNGSYYLDDAEMYDLSPDEKPAWEFVDENDNPDTQITSEGVDTTAQMLNTAWLDSLSAKQPKVYGVAFIDSNEDGKYQSTEAVVPGVTITQDKCYKTGGRADVCSNADYDNTAAGSKHKTGTTDYTNGVVSIRWTIGATGKYIRQTTTPPTGFYCTGNDCVFKRFIKGTSKYLRQGFLPAVSGVLKKQSSGSCTAALMPSECYKIFLSDGSYRWVARDGSVSEATFTANENKRVVINGPHYSTFTSQYGPRLAKTLISVDYAVQYGLGGGDVTDLTGNTTIQNDLNKPSTHPSAEWNEIEPYEPGSSNYEWNNPSLTVSSDLYNGMQYCSSNNIKGCTVSIIYGPSIPSWAKDAQDGSTVLCGDGGLRTGHIAHMAAFAGEIAELYKDVADSFVLHNEVDIQSGCTVDDYLVQYNAVAAAVQAAGGKMSPAGFAIENGAVSPASSWLSTKWVDEFFSEVDPDLVDRINIHWYENWKDYSEFCIGSCGDPNDGIDLAWSSFDPYSGHGGVRSKLNWLNGILQRHGIIGKAIVLGEIGDGEQNVGYRKGTGPIDQGEGDAIQKTNLFKEFAHVYSTDLPISSVLWFKLKGAPDPDGDFDDNTNPNNNTTNRYFRKESLIYNGTNRPSYTAYKAIAGELKGMKFSQVDLTSGIEGYIFVDSSGGYKEVLWSRSGNTTKDFNGGSGTVRKITTGNVVTTVNADDVQITPEPIIIDY